MLIVRVDTVHNLSHQHHWDNRVHRHIDATDSRVMFDNTPHMDHHTLYTYPIHTMHRREISHSFVHPSNHRNHHSCYIATMLRYTCHWHTQIPVRVPPVHQNDIVHRCNSPHQLHYSNVRI